MTSTRMAGSPEVADIIERFLEMEPRPAGVAEEAWAARRGGIGQQLLNAFESLGRDSRDYMTEPGVWRSQLLPKGVGIDRAILDGVW